MVYAFNWNSQDVSQHPDILITSHWWYANATDPHYHDHYEIFFIVQGEATHIVNKHSQTLVSKSLCLIRPNEQHKLIPKTNSTLHYNLDIENAYFERLCQNISPLLKNSIDQFSNPITIKLQSAHLRYFIDLAKSYDLTASQANSTAQILKTLVSSILLDVHMNLPASFEMPPWFQTLLYEIGSPSFISKTVNDAYNIAPCAPCTLIDYFHKYLGCTPSQYLVKKKMSYACSLLKNTNFTILYITNELGFSSLSHFNKIFKKETGLPPSQYRKLYQPKGIMLHE